MISTHSPKFFNARLKVNAISSQIINNIQDYFICSSTTNLRKRYFASPANSADMKKWRNEIENISENDLLENVFPKLTDPHLKQLLLPLDDNYISVTPVVSCGIMHEMFHRLKENEAKNVKWIVQPTPSAVINHGEGLLLQGGKVKLMRRGVVKINNESYWKGDFVQLTARCENMSIASGMLSIGFPAITAIGGFIHAIERKVNSKIEYAVGIKSTSWSFSATKQQIYKASNLSFTSRVGNKKITASPGYSTEEIKGTCEIVILFRSDYELSCIAEQLKNIHKLAGGNLFDIDISVVKNGEAPKVNYLVDISNEISELLYEGIQDSLQAAINLYKKIVNLKLKRV